jgi:serine/threonine protein kinase
LKTLHSSDASVYGDGTGAADERIYELLHEAFIMTRLRHVNLLTIIGVTFFGDEQQLTLVTEFMSNGSLLDYLRRHRDTLVKADVHMVNSKLNGFSQQIFRGMFYLEQQRIIHRDLAARNCLIGHDDMLKVGDFGLTKFVE